MLFSNIFISILSILAFIAIVSLLTYSTKNKTKLGINVAQATCPECNIIQPKVRKPQNLKQILWGGSTCTCGCELDKYGRKTTS